MTIPTWLFWFGAVLLVVLWCIPSLIMILFWNRVDTNRNFPEPHSKVLGVIFSPVVSWVAISRLAQRSWLVNQVTSAILDEHGDRLWLTTTRNQRIDVSRTQVAYAQGTFKAAALNTVNNSYVLPDGTIVSSDPGLAELNLHYPLGGFDGHPVAAIMTGPSQLIVVSSTGKIYSLGGAPEFAALTSNPLAGLIDLERDSLMRRPELVERVQVQMVIVNFKPRTSEQVGDELSA